MIHGEFLIDREGKEVIWPGRDPYCADNHGISDWIAYGLGGPPNEPIVYGASRDYVKTCFDNRDRHYADRGQSIDLLKEKCLGKRFLIVCPGPSVSAVLAGIDLPDDVVVIAINKAVGFIRLDKPLRFALIMERHAREDWLRPTRSDLLAPWIPNCPLITVPESSAWLADLWPAENRYYCNTYFHNIPKDSREQFPKLLSWYITPTLALDLARYLGASKIILVGCDLSFDMAGRYYWDTHYNDHPNAQEHADTVVGMGIGGELCQMTQAFTFHRNCMEGVIYWIERTARIPVLNATGAGILDWRPTSLEEALHGTHEPIVDYFTGEIEGPGSRAEPDAQADIQREVARPELQGALACG